MAYLKFIFLGGGGVKGVLIIIDKRYKLIYFSFKLLLNLVLRTFLRGLELPLRKHATAKSKYLCDVLLSEYSYLLTLTTKTSNYNQCCINIIFTKFYRLFSVYSGNDFLYKLQGIRTRSTSLMVQVHII